ncbi:hmg box protein [Ophiostoma piceae UAMH 11346]|uniref:Hmg box protein n=1 Tax=Ophiostoma piceae (strain UAMH 11346) TaxID=1262450 RepID=S3BWC8_OPHP1|nr:hmg box protein [Ophiostoma piceae UAMH 11346]
MSSTFRIAAARSGLRIGSAAVKTTGSAGLVAASRAGARPSSAAIAASCRVSQLAFTRGFGSTADDKAAAATEETAAPKTKKAAPKKAAAKKPVKKPAKKVAKKVVKKVKVKKVKAKKVKKAKKVAKPKVKKILTEEQKEKQAVAEHKKKVRALRAVALLKDSPPTLPSRSWVLFMAEHIKDSYGSSAPDGRINMRERMVELSREFKALSAQELESLRTRASQNHEQNVAAYKVWVEGYPIATIAEANRARRTLTRLAKEGKATPLSPLRRRIIEDHRLPKRPMPLFSLFTRDQWVEGELHGQSVSSSGKDLSEKWKGLSEAEREKYVVERAAQVASYEKELAAALEKTTL